MDSEIVRRSKNRIGGLIYLAYQERLMKAMAEHDMRKANRIHRQVRNAEIGLANWYYSHYRPHSKDR